MLVNFSQGCLAVAISRMVMPKLQMSALRPYASCLITCRARQMSGRNARLLLDHLPRVADER